MTVAAGQRAHEAVESSRAQLAALLACDPREIVWTSGATEANNLALKGVAHAPVYRARRRIITLATEHKAVLDPCAALEQQGWELVRLPVEGDGSVAYLRPETAQGIFLNFGNVVDTMRVKIPFGIAQVGKAFRNEVTPRNYIFRSREFEQMEIEWFCHPDDAPQWFEFWCDIRRSWWESLGLTSDNVLMRKHDADAVSYTHLTLPTNREV